MNGTIRISAVMFVLILSLAGCAANYTFQGVKYNSAESFHAAVNRTYILAVEKIVPLPAPINSKDLIVAIPSLAAFDTASIRWYKEANGSEPYGLGSTVLFNLNEANYAGIKVFYDGARKKNIYAHIRFIDLDSTNGSVAPSNGVDVLYMVEPTRGSSQWFYASSKSGKQIFAYDRSAAGVDGKLKGFLDALQIQALRD